MRRRDRHWRHFPKTTATRGIENFKRRREACCDGDHWQAFWERRSDKLLGFRSLTQIKAELSRSQVHRCESGSNQPS